jgi:putative FmdB family regulatory protein
MPLYEYRCTNCGEKFEIIQKSSDVPLKNCPNCGGPLKKLFSPPMLQFKGSGWYITDYSKKAKDKGEKEGKKSDNSKEK